MKYLLILTLTSTFSVAASEDSKEIKIEATEIGSVRVFHEYLGEPIAAPERLTVSIKCKNTGATEQVALFRLCKFDSYSFERANQMLTLKMISGRVIHHSGEVVCDQVDQKSVDLASVCKETK